MQNVKLTWTGDASGIYEIQYKKTSSDSWTIPPSSPVNGLEVILNNLDDNTDYSFRVREYCPNGPQSPWIYNTFRTHASACIAPTNLTVSNIHETTADVSWNVSSTAIGGYYVEYKSADSNTWLTTSVITSTYYTLSGLTDGTSYQVRVKSICADGGQATSTAVAFNTLEILSQCALITSGSVSITVGSSNYTATYTNSGGTPSTHTLEYSVDNGSSWGTVTSVFNQTITSAVYNLPGNLGIFPISHMLRVTPKCADGSLGTSATGSYTAPEVFTQYVTFQNRLDAGSVSSINIDGNPNILSTPIANNSGSDKKWNQTNLLGNIHTITGQLTGVSNGVKLLLKLIRDSNTLFSGNSIYMGGQFTWLSNQQLLNGDIIRIERDATTNINATLKLNVNDYTDHCHSQGAGFFSLSLGQAYSQPITIQFAYVAYNANGSGTPAGAGGDIVPLTDPYKANINSNTWYPAQVVIPANTTVFTNSNSNVYSATSLVFLNKSGIIYDFTPGDIIGEHGAVLYSFPDCNPSFGTQKYRIYYKVLTTGINLIFTGVSGDVSASRMTLIKV